MPGAHVLLVKGDITMSCQESTAIEMRKLGWVDKPTDEAPKKD